MTKKPAPTTTGRRDEIERNAAALEAGLEALAHLTFEERIRTIRWICDFYGIARVALYQGDGTFKEQT